MKIIFSKRLQDGRYVSVYDDGSNRGRLIVMIKIPDSPQPQKIILKDAWDLETELIKILHISKDELGFTNGK